MQVVERLPGSGLSWELCQLSKSSQLTSLCATLRKHIRGPGGQPQNRQAGLGLSLPLHCPLSCVLWCSCLCFSPCVVWQLRAPCVVLGWRWDGRREGVFQHQRGEGAGSLELT